MQDGPDLTITHASMHRIQDWWWAWWELLRIVVTMLQFPLVCVKARFVAGWVGLSCSTHWLM